MFFDKNAFKVIRNTELKIHCLSVRIWQDMPNGIELTGHGTIKQNKFGTLYIEFVCTNTVYNPPSGARRSLNARIPANSLNPSEKIYAEFEALNGERFTSEGFTLTINLFERNRNKVIYIHLPYVQSVKEREGSNHHSNYLYYEFCEKVDVPANVLNETKSTKGSESSSWDETKIEHDSFELVVQDETDHTIVKVSGDFDTEKMVACANFYIGFSCGVMPQAYVVVESMGSKSVTRIKSFNNQNSRKRSSNPIPSDVGIDGKASGAHSYDLFKQIFSLQQNEPNRFASIWGQWERVWYGFTSVDEISELVLSVAVEGLLNDVYIPVFKQTRTDAELEAEINAIKKMFDELDISKAHRDRLKGSVSYWKNITAAKALDLLVSEGVIDTNDKKVWNKLRNDSAHPKIKELNSAEEQEKLDNVLDCLNLFHRLVLNIIGYTGPVNIFSAGQDRPLSMIQNKDVLS
ncbi:hypothetical protein [Vibrio syngnathi]|uniref:ApeA N-terminal domain-containing protein n=1 Tax=Vibrio syngnathi TaxID=3034029 RepID=A0AA34TTK7_9VIBR|nr:hypothetical protein [Vibrio syngnathi]ARP40820.1 hypothetical protein K08M4_41680 [Vibrio syngnathi]